MELALRNKSLNELLAGSISDGGGIIDFVKNKFPIQMTKIVEKRVVDSIETNLPLTNIKIEKKNGFEVTTPAGSRLSLSEPVEANKYKGTIPERLLGWMYNLEQSKFFVDKIKDNEIDFEYYVSDVKNNPDPLLFIQIGGKKELTFLLGNWQ